METPSSARRITRSQAAAAASACNTQKSKQDDSYPRPRNGAGDRSALIDITNDSPVVGLAAGSLVADKTPSSSAVKSRVRVGRTPGSGEEVLRGQVRTLLQKVEEDAVLVNKPPFGARHPPPSMFPALLSHLRSPLLLLAPTPANTPQIPVEGGFVSMEIIASPCVVSQDDHPKVGADATNNPEEIGECQINRALTFDSPEKSIASAVSSVSSTLTDQFSSESSCQEKSPEDDNSSIWSIQANASPNSEGEDELFDDIEEEDYQDYYEEVEGGEEEEEEEEEGLLDGLCEDMKKLVVGDKAALPEFTGKHTRFVYNSDDEIEGEEEVNEKAESPSVVLLKGLPAPEGKHLRFQDEDGEE